MLVLQCRNVNDALPKGIAVLEAAPLRESRNGPVRVHPTPVTTVYERPWERVLLYPLRDANPFFHLMESVWMLGGRADVKTPATYVSRMRQFSDDGKWLHGAYGRRWRQWFASGPTFVDQLQWAVKRLKADPNDRRVVIQMWDATVDPVMADAGGKDVPCNTQIYLWVDLDQRLAMTVMCRSNDVIWGAYGANAVHFSVLQEYLACALDIPPGRLYQVSNNYHAYVDVLEKLRGLEPQQPYNAPLFQATPPVATGVTQQQFDEDVTMLLDEGVTYGLRTPWLRKVVVPVMMAHAAYREKGDEERHAKALEIIGQCRAGDWRVACTEWLLRRQAEAQKAQEDGVQHD